jgi:hypothetical protein
MDFGFESTLKHLLIFLRDNYGLQTFDANSKRLPSIELKLFDLKDQKKKSNFLPVTIDSDSTLEEIYFLVDKNTDVQLEFRDRNGLKLPLNTRLLSLKSVSDKDNSGSYSLFDSLKPAILIANKKASGFDIDWINRILWNTISQTYLIEEKYIIAAAIKIIYEKCPNISKYTLREMLDDLEIESLSDSDFFSSSPHSYDNRLIEAIDKFQGEDNY